VVAEGRDQAAVLPSGLPAAELPLAVYAAANGRAPAPLPLAAACLCVYLGADLLDNVVDRELSDRWVAVGPNQSLLAGVTFLTPLAVAAVAELDVPAATRLAVQDALIDALLAMSAGQAADVAFEGRADVSLAACEAMVLAKSGAEWALFARVGALLAGAPAAVCDDFATFGRELGATSQVISDGVDLAAADGGRDLAAGKRTLPVVHALAALSDPARGEVLGHLAAAPHDPARKTAAREALLAAGALHFAALVAEAHRQRALTALRQAAPVGPASQRLYDWVADFRLGRHSANASLPTM
jgi:geranylgeranyl diphosphate synthase type I